MYLFINDNEATQAFDFVWYVILSIVVRCVYIHIIIFSFLPIITESLAKWMTMRVGMPLSWLRFWQIQQHLVTVWNYNPNLNLSFYLPISDSVWRRLIWCPYLHSRRIINKHSLQRFASYLNYRLSLNMIVVCPILIGRHLADNAWLHACNCAYSACSNSSCFQW